VNSDSDIFARADKIIKCANAYMNFDPDGLPAFNKEIKNETDLLKKANNIRDEVDNKITELENKIKAATTELSKLKEYEAKLQFLPEEIEETIHEIDGTDPEWLLNRAMERDNS